MIIATYESKHPDLSPNRRWLAQIEKIKGNFYVCFHGATEDEAREKAEAFVRGEKPKKAAKEAPIAIRPEDEDLL